MTEFKYLGYHFHRNNSPTYHVQELVRRGGAAMGQVWRIGQKLFGGDFKTKTLMFDSMVKSIILYAAEIWGWSEYRKLEALQERYLKWCLGLPWYTPGYVVMEETKRDQIRVEAGKRAVKFEERIEKGGTILLRECLKEKLVIREGRGRLAQQRVSYLQRNGCSEEELVRRKREGEKVWVELCARDREVQRQCQYNKIMESRSCPEYKNVMLPVLPPYLAKRGKQELLVSAARRRCPSCKYWELE